MKFQSGLMPIIPAAAPLLAQAHLLFLARDPIFSFSSPKSSAQPVAPPAAENQQAGATFGGDWLYAEDEYFPFDADSFEER